MRYPVSYAFSPGYDGTAILEQLDQVLDPELDESILQLGFVRALRVDADHVTPHTEAFQAVIWHLLVSHPTLKAADTKWESTSEVAAPSSSIGTA